ncbi:hypothetical protein ANO11243_035600 [Dothideomycetidae sp. 11243]|nr:hypothetical protein ANO11243_035600 [fungal sp. No.11243]
MDGEAHREQRTRNEGKRAAFRRDVREGRAAAAAYSAEAPVDGSEKNAEADAEAIDASLLPPQLHAGLSPAPHVSHLPRARFEQQQQHQLHSLAVAVNKPHLASPRSRCVPLIKDTRNNRNRIVYQQPVTRQSSSTRAALQKQKRKTTLRVTRPARVQTRLFFPRPPAPPTTQPSRAPSFLAAQVTRSLARARTTSLVRRCDRACPASASASVPSMHCFV